MKRKRWMKGSLALALAMVTAVSTSVPAFAQEFSLSDFNDGAKTPTSFYADTSILGGDLIISIPAELILVPDASDTSATKFSKTDVVSAKGRASANATLSVSVVENDTNSSTDGIQIDYANKKDATIKAEGTVSFKDDDKENGVREWTAAELLASLTTLDARDITVEVPKDNVDYVGTYTTKILYKVTYTEVADAAPDPFVGSIFRYVYDDDAQTAEVSGFNWNYNLDNTTHDLNDEFGTTSFTIPETAPNGYTVVALGNNAFNNCRDLTSIDIPDTVTAIQASAFFECRSLTDINFPSNLESIGQNAFLYSGLTRANIPDSVTSLGESCFAYTDNSSLITINIGNGVTALDKNMFANAGTYFIGYNGTSAEWDAITKTGSGASYTVTLSDSSTVTW